jgi:DNA polymerase-4
MTGIACERARLPHLHAQPFALRDDKGLLAAVSPEAFPFGVRRGQAATFARSLCQGLVVLPYDTAVYLEAAQAIWDTVAVESSIVEPVSPEVVFAEISGTGLLERIKELADCIADAIGAGVCVGLGKSKLVAIQAARLSEGNPVMVAAGRERPLLSPVPLADLPALKPALVAKAEKLGVHTLGDLMALPVRETERQFGQSAHHLRELAKGDDGDRVRALWPPRIVEYALRFDDEVTDEGAIHHALGLCASHIARMLAIESRYCRTLTLEVEMNKVSSVLREELNEPTHDPGFLQRAAIRLFDRLKISEPVTRLHLEAGEISAGSGVQLSFLDESDENGKLSFDDRKSLDAAVKHLKEKYGVGAVVNGGLVHQAQRIHLWTYPLGHVSDEAVRVVTNPGGLPVRLYREMPRSHETLHYMIVEVQNQWRETDWSWGKLSEKTCYRVATEPDGLYELHQLGGQWRLRAVAD